MNVCMYVCMSKHLLTANRVEQTNIFAVYHQQKLQLQSKTLCSSSLCITIPDSQC